MLYGLQCFVTVQRLAWLTDGDGITTLGTSGRREGKWHGGAGDEYKFELRHDFCCQQYRKFIEIFSKFSSRKCIEYLPYT